MFSHNNNNFSKYREKKKNIYFFLININTLLFFLLYFLNFIGSLNVFVLAIYYYSTMNNRFRNLYSFKRALTISQSRQRWLRFVLFTFLSFLWFCWKSKLRKNGALFCLNYKLSEGRKWCFIAYVHFRIRLLT